MNVLIAGATGVVGRRLVPALVAAGHHVTGTSRSQQGVDAIAKMGGIGVTMDASDEATVTNVVLDAAPDVVIHQLTAIGSIDLKNLDDGFAATNRLRTDGLDHLLKAATLSRGTALHCSELHRMDQRPHRRFGQERA